MPVILETSTPSGLTAGVWQITENENELLKLANLTGEEKQLFLSFKNEGRRLQWLAVRALLSSFLSPRPTIAYQENGKPYLPGRKEDISISHSGTLAAIALSPSGTPGIDVEEIHPKIHKIAERFINSEENKYLQQNTLTEQLCIIWAAKEVLYKIHPEGLLSFKENLSVGPFTLADNFQLKGTINKDGKITHHKLTCTKLGNYVLVYTE